MRTAEEILSEGMTTGYGKSQYIERLSLFGFLFNKIALKFNDGEYMDMWSGERVGAGRELARGELNGEYLDTTTRVYGGGTISPDILEKLGITEAEIIGFLKSQIKVLGDKTRNDKSTRLIRKGHFSYKYKVIRNYAQIPLTLGVEEIRYDGEIVFIHAFILCPVK